MARIELIDDDPPAPVRRPRADVSARKNPVGGDVVASMKRGMRRGESTRLWVLGAVALLLLVVLNWAWLARIHRRVVAAGGWGAVASSAREWLEAKPHRGEM